MGLNKKEFARLLTEALRLIKAKENKNISLIQDELAIDLGKDGEYSIGYWRRGNIPANPHDVYKLAKLLVRRMGLDLNTCIQFLKYADYPDPEHTAQSLFNDEYKTRSLRPASIQNMNPFVVGPPIQDPKQFYGRQQELTQVFTPLNRLPLQHTAVIGPRRSGKSSFLNHIRTICYTKSSALRSDQKNDWLTHPNAYRWVYVDFQDPRTHTLERLLASILGQVIEYGPNACQLDQFMDLFIPVLDRPLIFLMDEIDAALIAEGLPVELWWGLRSLMNSFSDGNIAFIISSHRKPAELAEERGKSSPFFNIFQLLTLGPFKESEAKAYLNDLPFEIEESDRNWILNKSHRWPIILQHLSQILWMSKFEQGIDNWQADAEVQLQLYQHLLSR